MLSTRRVGWNFLGATVTFWDSTHAIFNIQGTELTPTIEEYRTLISRTVVAHSIVEPNLRTTQLVLVSRLVRVTDLSYMPNCVANRIDAALASFVLQVVGGYGYEVALMAETIESLDRVTQITNQRLRGSPILLQIWLQSHASPFGLVRPILFFNCSESIISRLLPLMRVEEHKISEWIKIFREVSPKGFKWRVAWMPPGAMALRCHDFNGIPLLSHVGSTIYFPARVMRQFGSLQTVPEDTARTRFQHTWREDQTSVDCQSDIQQVLSAWHTAVTELPYFHEHPTQDEWDFQATEEYILHFYRWIPLAQEDFTGSPRPEGSTPYGAPSTSSMAVQAELTNLRSERDCHRSAPASKGARPDMRQVIEARTGVDTCERCPREVQEEDPWSISFQNSRIACISFIYCLAATTHFYATGEWCPPSWVDHPRSSPLYGETCYDQRPLIVAAHPARQSTCANLREQATYGLHPSSMARKSTTRRQPEY
ncbi:hypothetical protein CRG98_013433 [Punica granatum]|uniref:DUF7745 domain-containing protein n=1 Tax=Punica granatum TaxID=22663 RepID=A0A2I0KD71_PUNGR|nr:hypothetical protein CRG98_013433 [Punica granatum]